LNVGACVSVYKPSEDMAFGSEVDMTRDLRWDTFQPESLQSPHDDFVTSGLLDEVIEQEALSEPKKRVKSKVSAARDLNSFGSQSASKHHNNDVVKHDVSKSAFQSLDSQGAVHSSKEMKPLQLQKSSATKKPSEPDVQTKSSKRRSKRKEREDLNEILRKRLDKLEAKLNMIGAQHSIPDITDSAEDILEEKEMGDGRRILSQTSHAEKRKAHHSQNYASDSKFAKRRRTDDDDLERIIAANVDEGVTNGANAKSDEYTSTLTEKQTIRGEELSTMSASFSDEIISVIGSHWEPSQNNQLGNLYMSSSSELADTETIMYNVLLQNVPEVQLSPANNPASDPEIDDAHNAVGMVPQVADTSTFSLPCESVEPEPESKENVIGLENHEDGKHLGCLSVDTQWDSQFVESFVVKSTHLNSVQDWRGQKLLDLLISGRLKEIPSGMSLELEHEGTDRLVSSSLQNILSNLSWLWSVAVGDNMLSSVQDVVSSSASNLDSLTIDYVENSGCMDIPVSISLSSDQVNDDASGKEVASKEEPEQEEADWSCEESLLLESLFTSIDVAQQKVLIQTEQCSVTDVAEASAASFGSLLEHAIDSRENTGPIVTGDLYSPTRPTEVDLALSSGVTASSDVDTLKGVLHTEQRNEVQLSADVTDALNDLVENSAPTRRTVRVHRKEAVTVIPPSDPVTGAAHKGGHWKSGLRALGEETLGAVTSQMSHAGLTSDKSVILESNLPVSEDLPVNWSAELSNIAEVEVATDSLQSKQAFTGKQMQDIKSVDEHIADIAEEFDSLVESQYGMDSLTSPDVSHKTKSSKKRSHDQVSEKSASVKKESRSRKHKDSFVDATSKKNKKKSQDMGKPVDRQLKADVQSELKHVQKSLESLLHDKHGIDIGSTATISHDVSLYVDDKHFPDLSGLSFDPRVALMSGENKTDNALKAVYSSALLSDLFTELNVQLPTINLTLPKNTSVRLTDAGLLRDKLSAESSDANVSQLQFPSSPPSMRRRTGRSASRRNKSSEAGVNITPHRQQEPAVTENEKRLMKADKLMQTFRRSQIAKRQTEKAGPQPTASFIRQVQTVTPSEGLESIRLDTADSDVAVSLSEVKAPDFGTVITDGSVLASVELPDVTPTSLQPQNDNADMQSLSPKLPETQPAEAAVPVTVSATPALPRENTVSNSEQQQQRVSNGGKERRVYVFKSDNPVSQEVEVSSDSSFLNCETYVLLELRVVNLMICKE